MMPLNRLFHPPLSAANVIWVIILGIGLLGLLLRKTKAQNPGKSTFRLMRMPAKYTAIFLTIVFMPHVISHMNLLATELCIYVSASVTLAGTLIIIAWYAWVEIASTQRRSPR